MSTLKLNLDADLENRLANTLYIAKAKVALRSLASKTCAGSEYTGWFGWPKLSGFKLLKDIEQHYRNNPVSYDCVVLVGIGGSYAGTKACEMALNHTYAQEVTSPYKSIYYLGHHLSELGTLELLEVLRFKNPLVVVVSKSGTTMEPSLAFRFIKAYLQSRYPQEGYKDRVIAITEFSEKSSLKTMADSEGYASFEIPKDVGGRYSVLTAVGMVPLFYAGYPVADLMAGADSFFAGLENDESIQDPVFKHAAVRRLVWDEGKTVDILAVGEPKLAGFVEWWKQLFGESEGKSNKGLLPSSVIYPTDLHSMGQYLQEGKDQMLETFLRFEACANPEFGSIEKRLKVPYLAGDFDRFGYLAGKDIASINASALEAAQFAHAQRGIPCPEVVVSRLDAFSLGFLFSYFQTVCAVSAILLELNPFDQPGVEAYKKRMYQLLDQKSALNSFEARTELV